ncbi:HD domain-containing protein [Candidatus Woesearchaeota archaeon]|nr:HD domain-containing protein [Candidatus Woesearchaeota archaeon]
MEREKLKQLLEVFMTLQITKELPRQGFIYSGFKRNDVNSVAAHSFNVIAFSFLLGRELKKQGIALDVEKITRIALVHDMGEAITGDIGTWVKVLAKGRFEQVENKAFRLLVRNLTDKEDLIDLFEEYSKLETLESQIVKLADALDAMAQGLNTPGAKLDDWKLADKRILHGKVKDASLRKILEDAIEMLFSHEVTYFRGHIEDKEKTKKK